MKEATQFGWDLAAMLAPYALIVGAGILGALFIGMFFVLAFFDFSHTLTPRVPPPPPPPSADEIMRDLERMR